MGDWAEGRAVTAAREGPQWLWGPREGSTFICCLFFFVFNIYKVCFLIAHLLFGMK